MSHSRPKRTVTQQSSSDAEVLRVGVSHSPLMKDRSAALLLAAPDPKRSLRRSSGQINATV
jgi:hypothetical protein